MADEVLTCMGRTGKMFAMEHWDTVPDVMTLGKGFGNGFPVTAMLVAEKYKDVIEKISASTSYGGNPMACAAALASIEVIEEENLCERAAHLGEILLARMKQIEASSPIIGEVRGLGCLLGIELVKDKATTRAVRRGRQAGLPEGVPQGAGLDPGRPHPAHVAAADHGG